MRVRIVAALVVAAVAAGTATASTKAPRRAENAQLWVQRYDRAKKADGGNAVAVSPDSSKVFVTGASTGGPSNSSDFTTFAYDAASGTQIWRRIYDGRVGGLDTANAIAVSPDGTRVYVTGKSDDGPGKLEDYRTWAYDANTGDPLWTAAYDGTGHGDDEASAIAVTHDGLTVFVAGSSPNPSDDRDYVTIAYDAFSGHQLWAKRYHGQEDIAYSLGINPGPAYSTTDREQLSYDYVTVAYDAASGAKQWQQAYDGPGSGDDTSEAITVAPDGSNVYVTGKSIGASFDYDYATVAYAALGGAQQWVQRYDGPAHGNDFGNAIAASPDGANVYVTGGSPGVGTGYDFATIGYSSS
jgi:hypothetical protein